MRASVECRTSLRVGGLEYGLGQRWIAVRFSHVVLGFESRDTGFGFRVPGQICVCMLKVKNVSDIQVMMDFEVVVNDERSIVEIE